MPLLQGNCIPPVCIRVRFNLGGAAVVVFDSTNGVVDAQRSAGAAVLFAQTLANWIASFAPIDFKCDGCTCHLPAAAPVPTPIPDVFLARAGKWETVIRGGTYTFELGFCRPPKAKLQGPGWIQVPGLSRAARPTQGGKAGRQVAKAAARPRGPAKRRRRS
jgi:hypothetical protein